MHLLLYIVLNFANASWLMPNNPISGPGDPGSFYLNKPGFTFHLNNNDYLGKSDKLMTSSNGIMLYLKPFNNAGLQLSTYQRLITPIVRPHHGVKAYDPPRGIYAEGFVPRLAFSYLKDNWKVELSASAEIYGEHGVTRLYKFVHDTLDIEDKSDRFPQKVDRSYLAGSIGFGYLMWDSLLLMVYGHNSPIMEEAIARLNYRYENASFQLGLQIELANQISSRLYGEKDLVSIRRGGGISFKWDWYQFSANCQSVYLKFDRYEQCFIDPLILSYEF